MATINITFTPENSEYISLITRVSGATTKEVVNAALDIKRAQDEELVKEIKAMIERIGYKKPETQKTSPDEYANRVMSQVRRIEERHEEDARSFDRYFEKEIRKGARK